MPKILTNIKYCQLRDRADACTALEVELRVTKFDLNAKTLELDTRRKAHAEEIMGMHDGLAKLAVERDALLDKNRELQSNQGYYEGLTKHHAELQAKYDLLLNETLAQDSPEIIDIPQPIPQTLASQFPPHKPSKKPRPSPAK